MRFLFQKDKQKELLKREKELRKTTWKELAGMLDMKPGKLMAFFNEEVLIDKLTFSKLKLKDKYRKFILNELNENWGQTKGGKVSKGNTKEIKIPKKCKELAEFYGIMLGDGNSNKTKGYKLGTYMIRIVGDSRKDKDYLVNYVKPIIENLFDIKVRTGKFKKQNAIFIEAHGIKLIDFLEKKGFKPGNKIKNRLNIPDWIKNNKEYLKACVRGLIDTDGSFYKLTNQNSHQINFKNFNEVLLKDVRDSLLSLGINCSKISKGNSIYITKKAEITKFFKLIGFRNSRHLNKIKGLIAPSSSGQIISSQKLI